MSGTIELIISDESPYFKKSIIDLNKTLNFYGLPIYKPDYTFYKKIKENQSLWQNLSYSLGIDVGFGVRDQIQTLQTIFIELKFDPNWTPENNSLFVGQQLDLDLAKEVFGTQQSHLVLFNFQYLGGGNYAPISFDNVEVPDSLISYLGSSFNLRDELRYIANKLNFELGEYTDNFEILSEEKYYELLNKKDSLIEEKLILLLLYHIALASIKYNLLIAIDFH